MDSSCTSDRVRINIHRILMGKQFGSHHMKDNIKMDLRKIDFWYWNGWNWLRIVASCRIFITTAPSRFCWRRFYMFNKNPSFRDKRCLVQVTKCFDGNLFPLSLNVHCRKLFWWLTVLYRRLNIQSCIKEVRTGYTSYYSWTATQA